MLQGLPSEWWQFGVDHHDKFGGSAFLQVTIGLNVAVKGVAFFRNWTTDLYSKMFRRSYSAFATVLDKASKTPTGPAKLIEREISQVASLSERTFRFFSIISWLFTIYALGALYLDISHCSHLMLVVVWPTYVASVWVIARLRAHFLHRRLSTWQKVNNDLAPTPENVPKEISDLRNEINREPSP